MKNYECITHVEKRFSNFKEYARYIVSHSLAISHQDKSEPEVMEKPPELLRVPHIKESHQCNLPLFYMSPIGMVLPSDRDGIHNGLHERISIARY